MTARFEDDRAVVRDMLQRDARALAEMLAPGGRAGRGGREWRAPNPFRGEVKNSGSFVVYLTGEAAGGFKEFDAGESEKGDVFDLIIRSPLTPATDFNTAMAWARARYNLPGPKDANESEAAAEARRARLASAKADAEARAVVQAAEAAAYDAQRIKWATSIWDDARPLRASGPVFEYLTASRRDGGRGCDPETVLGAGLREMPRLAHRAEDGARTHWPALICAVRQPDGALSAVHRIYVRPDRPGKAPVDRPRLILGAPRGAAIRLSPGQMIDGHLDEIGTEGVEDGLHLLHARPAARVLALVSVAGFQNFTPVTDLPRATRRILVPDNDWTGGPAAEAFADAASRIARAEPDVQTRIARMPVGKDADDFNNRRQDDE
jgi:hypothetical protein